MRICRVMKQLVQCDLTYLMVVRCRNWPSWWVVRQKFALVCLSSQPIINDHSFDIKCKHEIVVLVLWSCQLRLSFADFLLYNFLGLIHPTSTSSRSRRSRRRCLDCTLRDATCCLPLDRICSSRWEFIRTTLRSCALCVQRICVVAFLLMSLIVHSCWFWFVSSETPRFCWPIWEYDQSQSV